MKTLFLILFLVVLLLLVPSVVLPQVHIKENVQIRPKAEFSISSSSSSSSLPYFEGSIVANSYKQGISVRRPCTIVGTGTFTSDSPNKVFLSILIILGSYPNEADLTNLSGSIQGSCGATVPIELWTWTSAAIVITNVEGSISGNQATYNFTGYQSFPHPINVPFKASVTLQAVPIGNSDPGTIVMNASPASLVADGSNELTSDIGATLFDNAGGQVQYCGTASMAFTIENPIEGVTLRGTGSDGLPREGTSIEVGFSESSSGVTLVWAGKTLSEDNVIVRVRADGFGLSATQGITLKLKNQLDHFEVRLEKDTVAFTETSKIFVQPKDRDNNAISLDPAKLLRFSLLGESAYGTFIKPNGDTLKTTPVELENIRYDDAKAGKVLFAAVAANPATSAKPLIRVSLQSDATKRGEKEIVVLEQTLKIVMVGERAVEPVVPPTVVNTPRAENRKQFTVRLTRGGRPVPNHPFRLTTDYVDGSGGHDHVAPRRTVSRENYGHFILRRTNTHHARPYDGQTQATGREELDHVASIFGDRMLIRVDSRQNHLLWDTTSIVERVPELIPLGPGQHYELVGAPNNHTGTNDPCRDASSLKSIHYRNHYGTSGLIQAIRNIATSYDSLNPGIRLRINDMSLEFGGLFDVGNKWLTGLKEAHAEHRIGENADIGFKGINAQNQCIVLNKEDLLLKIRKYTKGRVKTHDDHYHIRMRNI